MDIEFYCCYCGQHNIVDGVVEGENVWCPRCQKTHTIPSTISEHGMKTQSGNRINLGVFPPPIPENVIKNRSIDDILRIAETQTLHGAVREGDKTLAALLITRGADVNAKDNAGMTPLDLALSLRKNDMAEMLTAKGAITTGAVTTTSAYRRLYDRLFEAIASGDKDAARKMIVEIEAEYFGLDLERIHENKEAVKQLRAMGWWPTPLSDAVFYKGRAAVERLIAEGADVNAKDFFDGNTPLDLALLLGKEEIAKLLIEKGASKAEWLKAQEAASDRADEQGKAETGTDRYISDDVKDAVWRRDEGRCVKCKSNEKLEFDHIIPVSKGGSNTKRNVQLLCEKCNREKAAKIAY